MDQTVVHGLRREARARGAARPRGPKVAVVADEEVVGTAFRRYVPDDGLEPRWVAVFAHGGYFVSGDLNLQDGLCRRLALAIPADVISVDYALAPEHTATNSLDDVARCVDHARAIYPDAGILLCGDSAGGAVAFLVAAHLRDAGAPVDALFLTNPNLDLTLTMFDQGASGGPDLALLSDAVLAWAGSDPIGSGLSPLHTTLRDMPPTVIAVGQLDGLRPEGEEAFRALTESGIHCELRVFEGIGHGFMGSDSPVETAARDESLESLTTLLSSLDIPASPDLRNGVDRAPSGERKGRSRSSTAPNSTRQVTTVLEVRT